MVLFCIVLAQDALEGYSKDIGNVQRSAMKGFIKGLRASHEQKQEALQNLLLKLFTQDKHESSQYSFIIYRFFVLYSFRQEGCLSRSSTITQHISTLVFIGRATVYKAAKAVEKIKKKGFFGYVNFNIF